MWCYIFSIYCNMLSNIHLFWTLFVMLWKLPLITCLKKLLPSLIENSNVWLRTRSCTESSNRLVINIIHMFYFSLYELVSLINVMSLKTWTLAVCLDLYAARFIHCCTQICLCWQILIILYKFNTNRLLFLTAVIGIKLSRFISGAHNRWLSLQ